MKRSGGNLLPLFLGLFAAISAVWVIQTKHRNRELTSELEQLRSEHQRLDMEWAQLQLEEATVAQHRNIEQLARGQFGMVDPTSSVIVGAGQ